LGRCAQSLKKACFSFLIFQFLLILLTANMTREDFLLVDFLHELLHTTTLFVISPASHTCPTTCQAQNHTNQGVISCSVSFFFVLPHMLNTNDTFVGVVLWLNSFRRPPHMPSTKSQCDFVFGVFSSPYH